MNDSVKSCQLRQWNGFEGAGNHTFCCGKDIVIEYCRGMGSELDKKMYNSRRRLNHAPQQFKEGSLSPRMSSWDGFAKRKQFKRLVA